MPQAAFTADQLNALVAQFRREKAGIADQRREMAILIKQAGAEIERLTQRNREASYQMRQLEANLDGYSRAEIRQMYLSSQEAQMRLFMMQSQLEQLRNRQTDLDKTEELLDRVLEVADSLMQLRPEQLVSSADEGPASPDQVATPKESLAALLRSIELAHQRLSRQLQDGPAQVLSDLILRAEVCERLVERDRHKAKDEIGRLRTAASSALKSTRQLVYELQPPPLEELGLATALRRYVEASSACKALKIELHISGKDRRLSPSVEVAVFRIIQEAITNAAQHSGATRVDVDVHFGAAEVVATVADAGRGFDAEATLAAARSRGHSGLADLESRAELIGATLEIKSKPGSGCTVTVVVPA